ncbi:hypothetical protein [Proteus mirabilis]|uniref:hypothetical protein n=1 Tax=Proteus mirabilis TaxID=584 RepID=UPI0034D41038
MTDFSSLSRMNRKTYSTDYSLVNIDQLPSYSIYSRESGYGNGVIRSCVLPSTFEFVPGGGKDLVRLLNSPKYLEGIYTISKPSSKSVLDHLVYGEDRFSEVISSLNTKSVMNHIRGNLLNLIKTNGIFIDLTTIEPTNIYLSCNIHVDFSLYDEDREIDKEMITDFAKSIQRYLNSVVTSVRTADSNEWVDGFHVYQVCFNLINGRNVVVHFHLPIERNKGFENLLSHFYYAWVDLPPIARKIHSDARDFVLKEAMGNVFLTYQLGLY